MTSGNNPKEEHPQSQTEYGPATEGHDDTAQAIRTVVNELHTLVDEYRTRGEQDATNQRRNFRLSVVTAFLLLVYTTVTASLWYEARKATNATTVAARAAQESATVAKQTLEISVRPQLSIMRLEAPVIVPGQKGVELNARIINRGPGVALDIRYRTRVDTCPVEAVSSCIHKCPSFQSRPRVIGQLDLGPGEERSITYQHPRRTISVEEAEAVNNGTRALYFCGVHTYTNLFSDLQSFSFCAEYDKDVKKWAGCPRQPTKEQDGE